MMPRRPAWVFPAVIAAAMLMVVFWRYRTGPTAEDMHGEHEAQAASKARPSASVVLAIDPTKASRRAPTAAPPAASKTLAREYEQSRALRPLYDRISAQGGDTTAEAKYVLYRILEACARKTDKPIAGPPEKSWAERRKELEAQIPEGNPRKAERLKSFDGLSRCDGFENVSVTNAEMSRLLDDAARAGDPRARALQVQRELRGSTPSGNQPINDAQLQTLREAIASRDPAAIAIAGTVLSNTYADLMIEVGDNHEVLDPAASRQAWRLLACDYGLDCGAANRELQGACAFRGQCGPSTVPDLIYFYETTPNQAQLVEQYRQVYRRAVDANDWSALHFERRPNNSNSVWRFYYSGP